MESLEGDTNEHAHSVGNSRGRLQGWEVVMVVRLQAGTKCRQKILTFEGYTRAQQVAGNEASGSLGACLACSWGGSAWLRLGSVPR